MSRIDVDPSGNTNQGIVFKKSQGIYFVHSDGRDISCAISNQLRKQLVYPIAAPTSIRPHVTAVKEIEQVDPVAIGDRVEFVPDGYGAGLIMQVLPRRNKWVRRAAGFQPLEQIIVANLDQVVAVMAAADPAPKWELLDRYLVAAEAAELPAIVMLTKMDLADREEMHGELENYRRLGYRVILSSVVTGEGMAEVKASLASRLSVFIGKSGVGKSSLLNALQPGLGLRVKEISASTGKGKHTTTHLEMFDLEWGGRVVDTPGMREFGFWQIEPGELAGLFPEMRPYLGACRFSSNCSHTHEPGCAVQAAVADGKIWQRRYSSYLRLLR